MSEMDGNQIKKWWIVCLVLTLVVNSIQQSLPSSPTYVAGVVEFQPFHSISDPVLQTEANLAEYVRILQLPKTAATDIVVFPESTLNSRATATYVPEPNENVVPCTASPDLYEDVLRHISCMARNIRKYVVINLTEKSDCPDFQQIEFNDTASCAPSGINLYNANVVLDRRGAVVSKYRKYNLFGENGITQPKYPTSVSFTTDFNVTFGHFICFDLMFQAPALDLVNSGVTDIIFPTMWFSELPFLTAIQIQQSWAYKNNVNFLSSGANRPEVGSTGTGIFAGRHGGLVSFMSPLLQRDIYIATVPKKNFPNAPTPSPGVPIIYPPSELTKLYLKRDHLSDYYSRQIDLSNGFAKDTLCLGDFCCDFDITFTYRSHAEHEQHYYYHMAIFNGIRTFDGVADGGIRTCAIYACTDQIDVETCGRRFNATDNVVNSVRFDSITISTVAPSRSNLLLMPNSVDISILPLPLHQFTYEESPPYKINGSPFHNVTLKLIGTTDKLFAFAIYGRDFSMDDVMVSIANRTGVMLPLAFVTIFLILAKQLK